MVTERTPGAGGDMPDVAARTRSDGVEPGFERVEPGAQAIDQALRTVMQSQVHQSAMADTKANILITVCSIVVTLGLGQFGNPELRWPLGVLCAFALAALLLAILAVIPRIGRPGSHARGSLLFFGHLGLVPLDDYRRDLAQLLSDPAALYDTMARDIHGQAVILARRKFRYLRWAYMAFLGGLAAAMVTLAITLAGA